MKLTFRGILCLWGAGVFSSSLATLPVVEKGELEKTSDANVFSQTESLKLEEEFEKVVRTNISSVEIIDPSLLCRARNAVIEVGNLFLKHETTDELLRKRRIEFLSGLKCGIKAGKSVDEIAETLYTWDRNRAGESRSVEGTFRLVGSYAYCGDLLALRALSGSMSKKEDEDGDDTYRPLRNEVFFLGRNGQQTWEEYQRSLPAYEEAISKMFGGIFPAPK